MHLDPLVEYLARWPHLPLRDRIGSAWFAFAVVLLVCGTLRRLFRRRRRWTPEIELLPGYLSREDAYRGVCAFGATGSGKSSTLAHLMAALMRRGAGMLILTAKVTDYAEIARLAREEGRFADIRRFAPDEPWRLDFLDWEARSGSIVTAAQLMQDVVDFSSRMTSSASRDPFFPMAAARLLRMCLIVIWLATGACSVRHLYAFITSLPNSQEETKDPTWLKNSFCAQCLMEAARSHRDNPDYELAADFLLDEIVRMGTKTSVGIISTAMNAVEKYMTGTVRDLIASGQSNLSPEDVDAGRIVVVDMPVLAFREPGQFVQVAWKLLMQRFALRRRTTEASRDLCLWQDEFQLYAVPSVDALTQAVARSARLITVAATQDVNQLIGALGGDQKAEKEAFTIVNNLQTRMLFNNTEKTTNELFAATIGTGKQHLESGGTQTGGRPYDPVGNLMTGNGAHANFGFNTQYLPLVRPEEFARLRTGSRSNNYLVDCYVLGPRLFANGRNWIKATFKQRRR